MMEIYFGHKDGWKTEPSGRICLEPHIWLRAKGTIGNLWKMLKLSEESDRLYGTETLPEWEAAIRDLWREDTELCELQNAELEHKNRLRAAVAWRDDYFRKEEERFRSQKIRRTGKSHAERMNEIDEKYRRILADEAKHYSRELEAVRKRAARARKLAAAQMAEIEKLREDVHDSRTAQ